jgi:hypothetical protein
MLSLHIDLDQANPQNILIHGEHIREYKTNNEGYTNIHGEHTKEGNQRSR